MDAHESYLLLQVVVDYAKLLETVYPHLVLEPHIMSDEALKDYSENTSLSQASRCYAGLTHVR